MEGSLHPLAVAVMKEIGIDISGQHSKSVDSLDTSSIDVVISLSEEDVCPHSLLTRQGVKHFHWPIANPTHSSPTPEARLVAFRRTRDEILQKLKKELPKICHGEGTL